MAKEGKSHPVTAVASDRLTASLVDDHAIVGENAVEIEDDRSNRRGKPVPLGLGLLMPHEDLDNLKVDWLVDLESPLLGHVIHRGLAEESMAGLAETAHFHHVDRARFEELRLAILPHRPNPAVMVDPDGVSRCVFLPEEVMKRHDRQGRLRLLLDHRADGSVDILGERQRAGRLEKNKNLRFVSLNLPQAVKNMKERGFRRGFRTAQGIGTIDHLGSGGQRDAPNFGIVGRHDHSVARLRRQGLSDAVDEHRNAGDRQNVFPRNADGSSTGWDHRQDATPIDHHVTKRSYRCRWSIRRGRRDGLGVGARLARAEAGEVPSTEEKLEVTKNRRPSRAHHTLTGNQ